MYHAMPAFALPSTVTAVSSAPYSMPLAYVTCCIRVSLLSSVDSTSGANGSGAPSRSVEQGTSLRHCPSGNGPAFWLLGGGGAYAPTPTRVSCSLRSGLAVSSELVLVRLQVAMLVEVVPPGTPEASSAALE